MWDVFKALDAFSTFLTFFSFNALWLKGWTMSFDGLWFPLMPFDSLWCPLMPFDEKAELWALRACSSTTSLNSIYIYIIYFTAFILYICKISLWKSFLKSCFIYFQFNIYFPKPEFWYYFVILDVFQFSFGPSRVEIQSLKCFRNVASVSMKSRRAIVNTLAPCKPHCVVTFLLLLFCQILAQFLDNL